MTNNKKYILENYLKLSEEEYKELIERMLHSECNYLGTKTREKA